MSFQKEIKIIIILTVISIALSFSSINAQSNIIITKENSHKLPKSTIDIIDFDNVVVKNKEQIQIINISDSNNYKIIYDFILPKNKKYYSFQNGRFIILDEGHGNDFYESVYDVVTKQLINLQESDGSTGAVRIAQKDGAILYNILHTSKINDKKYGKILSQRNRKKGME